MATLQELLQQFAAGDPRQQARQALTSGNLSFFEGGEQRQLARNLFQAQQPPAPRFDISVTGFQPDLQGIAQERGLDTSRALDILNRAVNRPGVRQEFSGLLGRGPNVSAGRPLIEAIMGSVNPTAQSFLSRFLQQQGDGDPGGSGGPGGAGGVGGAGGAGGPAGPAGPPQIPGPATDTLTELGDLPGSGGPTFPQFGDIPEDELSRNISERLQAIITGQALEGATTGPLDFSNLRELAEGAAFSPAVQRGEEILSELARQTGFGDTPLGAAGEQSLIDIMETGGVDPNILFEVRKSLREQSTGELEAGQEELEQELAERGLSRGGSAREGFIGLQERLRRDLLGNLRDVATTMALQGQDRVSRAAEQALGTTLQSRGQRAAAAADLVSSGLEQTGQRTRAAQSLAEAQLAHRAQDINQFQSLLGAQLDAINQATGRALGIGDLALRNQIANQDFAQFLAEDQIRTAQFLESVRQAREGRVSGFLQLMLQFLGQTQQGFI